jgi:hypothetical protein
VDTLCSPLVSWRISSMNWRVRLGWMTAQLVGVDVLEQVAGGARLDRLAHPGLGLLDGQHHHPGVGHRPGDRLGGPDAPEDRHANVHQDHIRLDRLGKVDRLLAVARLGHHLEVGVHGEGRLDAVPGQRMVVCYQDANDVTHTVPLAGRSVHLDRTASGETNEPVDPDRGFCSVSKTVGGSPARAELGDAHLAALTTTQRAPLLLGETTPDTRILGRVQRPLETLLTDGAERADGLGRLHLGLGRPGGADREEQLGVDIAAAGTMAPIH